MALFWVPKNGTCKALSLTGQRPLRWESATLIPPPPLFSYAFDPSPKNPSFLSTIPEEGIHKP
ncbi:protein G6b-like protein [Corchorus olitorius]|uniref:Protein G6b-like protein n=1 Tax=Corchorus olitorius TaxID=93759 RepID=A0A1R3K8Y9_9ROSI|nr:protein G6b-like protein [Corchorus olitorius]